MTAISASPAPSRPATSDRLADLAAGRWTGPLIRRLGLPSPPRLRREDGPFRRDELAGRVISLGGAPGGYAMRVLRPLLAGLGAEVHDGPVWSTRTRIDVAVFDATGCTDAASLAMLRGFFGPVMRQLAQSARLVVIAPDAATANTPAAAATARAMEGFVRSLAKEVGRNGSTANLLALHKHALERLGGPLAFFCGHRSTYVSGRVLHVTPGVVESALVPAFLPRLQGKVAVVTGAARGLGAATAERLSEEGATVLCIDMPAPSNCLEVLSGRIGGIPLSLDITAPDAPARIIECLRANGISVDVLVHNAGITRDRTLLNMSEAEWTSVMAVNLEAIIRIDQALDEAKLLADGAREVCLSSISGIAGNVGQTNYAASKAALIGYVEARSRALAPRGVTVNGVAPGFIETEMTKRIPLLIREAGRRMNALKQGGQPRDVAEAVAFLSLPESIGVTGQTLRVCGQALLGA